MSQIVRFYYVCCRIGVSVEYKHHKALAQAASSKQDIDKALAYAEGCYDSYHTLQADNLWLPMDSLAELNNLVSLWMLTLEKQGCHNLIRPGSSVVIQAMGLSFGSFRFSNQQYTSEMLIFIYSDTNYVLDRVRVSYYISICLNNCHNHGKCDGHQSVCHREWVGPDCEDEACPNKCGDLQGQGKCIKGLCHCEKGYSGRLCDLHEQPPGGIGAG
uniref:EGF-like domain-containing protein n=1 Tax=Glossina pallidipes TaxID=7398 RepID=A0A1A9ZW02_GLOPL